MTAAVTGRFAGKHVVITGSGQGIGLAAARRIASEAGTVMLVDRAADLVNEAATRIVADGFSASALVADVSTFDGAQRMVAEARAAGGDIDVLVNNVGGTQWVKPFVEYEPEEIEAEIARSFWPTIWCCRAILPHFLERQAGCIVNVGSNSPRGIYRAPYAASKGGVMALTTALATELATTGIRVNCVAPGATSQSRTVPRNPAGRQPGEDQWRMELSQFVEQQIPMRRRGTIEEQAAAIAFMASDDASFITGQILSVAGGATVP